MARSLSCLLLLSILLCTAPESRAQQDGALQLDSPAYRFLERQQALGRLPGAFLSHQPLSAYEAQQYLDTLAVQRLALSPMDRRLLARFRGNAPEPEADWIQQHVPFLYENGQDFFSDAGPDYAFQVNPLLYLAYGRARQTARGDREPYVTTWQNTRGVRAAGHVDIGPLIFFESRLEENQRRTVWPGYSKRTSPRLGWSKFYSDRQVHDYWVATGLIGLRSEHFEVRFGRDRNRWGPGRTSLVLSDYAPVYDQLQLRTTVGRFQYTNLFARFTDLTSLPNSFGNRTLPNRYGAFHRLAVNLPGGIQAGVFEGVVFAPDATRGTGFDLAYLNPLIFYRAVEADRGSPDNVLLGLDASWTAMPGLQLYTQFLLDEFVLSEMFTDSWRNKWGWMAGLQAAGWPLSGLSMRLEYARLRPFLYSHRNPENAYLHYNDLFGHPAGPNAEDVALFLDYRPAPRWHAALDAAWTRRGRNPAGENVGANPRLSYNTRTSGSAPFLGGVRQTQLLVEARAGYEVLPQLFLEVGLRAESIDDEEAGLDRYVAPQLLLRWGLPFQSVRF